MCPALVHQPYIPRGATRGSWQERKQVTACTRRVTGRFPSSLHSPGMACATQKLISERQRLKTNDKNMGVPCGGLAVSLNTVTPSCVCARRDLRPWGLHGPRMARSRVLNVRARGSMSCLKVDPAPSMVSGQAPGCSPKNLALGFAQSCCR